MARLDGPRVAARSGRAKQLVVFLHGYGADGQDLIGLADALAPVLPDAAFASPHAPARVPGAPHGFQWFSLSRYDPNMLRRDPSHTADAYREMLDGAREAAPLLDRFLDDELARLGLGPEALALVGFSQGTMMALHVGLRRPALAAIVGFSGALVGADALAAEARCRPPVLLVHGMEDPVVPAEALFAALAGLGAAGLGAEFRLVTGLAHGIEQTGLERAARFLHWALRGTR